MPLFNLSYHNNKSAVHRLNPLVKITWTAGIVLLALLIDHPLLIGMLFISTVPVAIAAKVYRQWFMFIKLALWMGVVVVVINSLASNAGAHVLWQSNIYLPLIGQINITVEGLAFGVFMAVRLACVISAFALFSLTVHPDDLLSAMLILKLPYKTAMVTALSLRFVPVLVEDAGRISDAHRSRGLELDRGGAIGRIKRRASIIFSLLSNSLERTIQIAEAMEARAFGGSPGRTFYFRLPLKYSERITLIILIMVFGLGIFASFAGLVEFDYYPSLSNFNFSLNGWAIVACLVIGLQIILPLTWINR